MLDMGLYGSGRIVDTKASQLQIQDFATRDFENSERDAW